MKFRLALMDESRIRNAYELNVSDGSINSYFSTAYVFKISISVFRKVRPCVSHKKVSNKNEINHFRCLLLITSRNYINVLI